MYTTSRSNRVMGLALTSAMATALLAGCATKAPPRADLAANKAQAALAKNQAGKAIENAEAAVAAEPRNAAYRAMLGAAYLEAGRFASAETSFDDAMTLGDNSARTALSLALALTGQGKYAEASAVLNDWQDVIAPADLGLAYALAGQPERGVQIMSNAIRAGENTPKVRQNLAYAFALNGQWREARLMAAEDVPADQVGARMEEWSVLAHPEAWQHRVAVLLGAPAGVTDTGQPSRLALANTPDVAQLAAEAAAYAAAEPVDLAAATHGEVASAGRTPGGVIETYSVPPSERSDNFQTVVTPAVASGSSAGQVAPDTARFVQSPLVQTAALQPKQSAGGHLVQLGSFSSEQSARRAWGIYVGRYPELANHEMVITEAVVNGKRYWRVSAAGYDNAGSRAMCGRVKRAGEGCFAYAEGRPLPGALDIGVRLAQR